MEEQYNVNDQAGYFDLREVIRSFLQYKWYIIICSGLCGVLAAIASLLMLSPEYQASIYLIVAKPTFRVNFDASIQQDLYVPETSELSSLALSDGLLKLVLDELALDISAQRLRSDIHVIVNGSGQFELVVKNSEPILAAEIVNVWAEVLIQQINKLHGINAESIHMMEIEAEGYAARMENAQVDLALFLDESQIEVYGVKLTNSKNTLANLTHEMDINRSKIRNSRAIIEQLNQLEASAILPSGYMLSLLSLQQPSTYRSVNFDVQIFENDLITLQVSEAISIAEKLVTSLENLNLELEQLILDQEYTVTELNTKYEEENHSLSVLIEERNMARSVYYSLLNQIEEMKISYLQSDDIARVAFPADIPSEKTGSNLINNTIIGGLFGLVFSVGVISVIIWWNGND